MNWLKNAIAYFFGQGPEEAGYEFRNFSLAHFLPILCLIGIIFAIYKLRDRIRASKYERNIALTMAFVGLICEMSYFWRLVGVPSLGANPQEHLPITVCGWSVIFCSILILTKNQTLFDISYFWLFSGTVFALITPTVISYCGPTRFRYYQFWGEHTIGYIIIFYMIFVHKMRPTIKSAAKSYIAMAILAVIAYCANVMLGSPANYLFMAEPESTPSILDILPPNFAVRIVVMAAIITLMFALSYLPWYLKDRKARLATEAAAAESAE